MAQLVKRSLPIPEVRGSNPVIGKNLFYIEHLFTVNCVLKRRKEKEAGDGPFKKKSLFTNVQMSIETIPMLF